MKALEATRCLLETWPGATGHGSGWLPEPGDDRDPRRPRPPRRAAWHGIYTRPGPGGLTEWLAAHRGRALFRWAGPRVGWWHPLVSPWNPILAQDLTLSEYQPGWPDYWEQWTGDAIAAGWKAGGYFGIRPRRHQKRWVQTHRHRLAVVSFGGLLDGPCCYAAQPGTLADAYSPDALTDLADAYRAALVPLGYGHLADEVEAALADHANTPLIDLVIHHEDVPDAVCGLALGYPPEVTIGSWLHEQHHPGEGHAVETGAWCETSRTVAEPACPQKEEVSREQGRRAEAVGRAQRGEPGAGARTCACHVEDWGEGRRHQGGGVNAARRRRDRVMSICAVVCAVALIVHGVSIWLAESGLWLPIMGAVTALVGLALWARRTKEEAA